MARNVLRALGVALLTAFSGPFGQAALPASAPASRPVAAPAGETAASEVVLVDAGQAYDRARLERAFVVLRGADGRVPRAYLWDEPLGCPGTHSH